MKKQTVNEVMELQSKKRKKNKRRLKLFLAWLKLILLFAAVVASIVYIALSPLFKINKVDVKGAVYYNKEMLIDISGLKTGENGFRVMSERPLDMIRLRFGGAEDILANNCPYLKNVRVRFAIPSTVVIDVTERTAAFLVPFSGTSLLIDREGYVLEKLASGGKSKYTVLKGLKFEDCKVGEKLDIINIQAFIDAVKIYDGIKENDRVNKTDMLKLVDSIDASDASNIKLSLDSRITVNIGDNKHLNYRISAAYTLYCNNIKKSEKGVLDFTLGDSAIFSPDKKGEGK